MAVFNRTIPVDALPELEAAVAKLNKKAAKVGVPALVIAQGESKLVVTYHAVTGEKIKYMATNVTVTMAEAIKFNGFRFVGRLDAEATGIMVCTVPGEEMPERFRNATNVCDHCRKARQRKAYYVLTDDAGTHLQVGNSCLKDFLGHDATGLMWAGSLTTKLDEEFDECFRGSRTEPVVSKMITLALTAAVIREHGWVSKKVSSESSMSEGNYKQATAERVSVQLVRPLPKGVKRVDVMEQDRRMAQQAVRWFKSEMERKEQAGFSPSDYEHNLAQLVDPIHVSMKRLGLLCSLVAVAQRALNIVSERKAINAATPNQHVGKVGERREFAGKVISMNSYDSQWGVTHYMRVSTAEGFVVVKATRTWWNDQTDRGSDIAFVATIKKHTDKDGQLSTQVNRAVQK